MPRRNDNLTRHNIMLNAGDIAWLQQTYPGFGAASIIRALIERHKREVEDAVNRKAPVDALRIPRKALA